MSKKILEFVVTLHENKKATKDDINLPYLSYYGISKYLRDNGIIYVESHNERNQIVYALTEKGSKFAALVVQMKEVLNGSVVKEKDSNIHKSLNKNN